MPIPYPGGLARRPARRLRRATEAAFAQLDTLGALDDAELAARFAALAAPLADPEHAASGALADAAALVIEAARRRLGVTLYPVQVLGGLAVLTGCVAEMATGEGKTFTVLIPAAVHALAGRGVHVATANQYLATRDADLLAPVYRLLGLRVAVADHLDALASRQDAYRADVTYATAATLGFDYLADNLALQPDELVQRPLHACVVDEADSLLVDEARTPLVVSGQVPAAADWEQVAACARALDEGDVIVDRAENWAAFTVAGAEHAAALLGVDAVWEHPELVARLLACVRARFLFDEGSHYLVTGEPAGVVLVDEHTGRVQPDRRLRDGLHEALEALNAIPVASGSRTLASVTLQSFFGMYRYLGGLTGTASQLVDEFWESYGLRVAVVPPNRPSRRVDHPDRFYADAAARLDALVEEVGVRHGRGQPVLVGTASVADSEEISRRLTAAGVANVVLNARDHAREAQIIADAGRPGAVTVSTNMAGRGVDILLGGDPARHDDLEEARRVVLDAGGLCVLSACRYPSRRVDRQLRGRAGRQGDPGESLFLLCGEDELVRTFAPQALSGVLAAASTSGEVPAIGRFVQRAQQRAEEMQRAARAHMLEFDGVDTRQRLVFYRWRRALLVADLDTLLAELAGSAFTTLLDPAWDGQHSVATVLGASAAASVVDVPSAVALWHAAMQARLAPLAEQLDGAELDAMRLRLLRDLVLRLTDELWGEHLARAESLKSRAPLAAYAQRSPVAEYTDVVLDEFDTLMTTLPVRAVALLSQLRLSVTAAPADTAPADTAPSV